MGLCHKLNCCTGNKADPNAAAAAAIPSESNGKPAAPDSSKANDDGTKKAFNPSNGDLVVDHREAKEAADTNPFSEISDDAKKKKEPIYAQVQKRKSKVGDISAPPPKKGDFLVSFVVDSRGGAMTGCRGSGLRVILPPGAVEQPVRVTCRFIRPQSHNLPYPPPIMERDALASGVIEVGPTGYKFKLPVLVEIPYFASLDEGQRELVVLRSEDGEIWKEHDVNTDFSDTKIWTGEEGELYQDVVKSTDLNKAVDALDTGRIVRLSTNSFPKFFAILARVKGEVKSIGPEGGNVGAKAGKKGIINVTFPKQALLKKIKIGLQVQPVSESTVNLLNADEGIIDVYPLIGIYPRRRKFHNPIEISIPVISEERSKEVKKVWILCSLSSASERAVWEDVSDAAAVSVKGKKLVFETKVTALFWLITCSQEYSPDRMLHMASNIYKELTVSPYIARLTVYHRKSFPFAWCDALRIYLAVGDRMDSYIEQKDDNWSKVLDGKELEVHDRCVYRFDAQGGNMVLASDCQLEAKLDDRLVFRAFQDCSVTLLVRSSQENSHIKSGTLALKQQSNISGASRNDVYPHSTCKLDFGFGNVAEKMHNDYETIEVGSKTKQDAQEPVVVDVECDEVQNEAVEDKFSNLIADAIKQIPAVPDVHMQYESH